MAMMEFFGYTLISFGMAFSILLLFILSDPMRIILYIGGAFMYLTSLFLTSVVWFVLPTADEYVILTLLLFVAFQELFRVLYYLILSKARKGLESVTVRGRPIEHVHSLKNAQHTVAFVTGLGFGTMAGIICMLNMLAAVTGPGTIGLPAAIGIVDSYGDSNFFLYSAITTTALILLHTMWNVVLWHGCKNRSLGLVACVVISHVFCACISLLNQKNLHSVTLTSFYITLIAFTAIAYVASGGSRKALMMFGKNLLTFKSLVPPAVVNVHL